MAYTFKNLSDVETVIDLDKNDTVLVVNNGSVKQVDSDKLSSEVFWFSTSSHGSNPAATFYKGKDRKLDMSQGSIQVSTDEICQLYENGKNVKIFRMYNNTEQFTNMYGYKIYNGSKVVYFNSL